MKAKVEREELVKAVRDYLEANGGWVESVKFKQFLRRFGYKPSYVKYVISDLRVEGIIEVFRSPSGLWVVRLPKENV